MFRFQTFTGTDTVMTQGEYTLGVDRDGNAYVWHRDAPQKREAFGKNLQAAIGWLYTKNPGSYDTALFEHYDILEQTARQEKRDRYLRYLADKMAGIA